jgi:3-phosphoinositide dependent protein kinase-1
MGFSFDQPVVEQPEFELRDVPGMDRRDTFVGTPLYVSPEMLHETKSLPASDLWALGCIIYRMHVGVVPFEDKSETGTFDKILNRQLAFPAEANLSDATKDVIDKLLQVNPFKRLGAGRPGTPNDLTALKSHQYF